MNLISSLITCKNDIKESMEHITPEFFAMDLILNVRRCNKLLDRFELEWYLPQEKIKEFRSKVAKIKDDFRKLTVKENLGSKTNWQMN